MIYLAGRIRRESRSKYRDRLEAIERKLSIKKLFSEILQISQENKSDGVLFQKSARPIPASLLKRTPS